MKNFIISDHINTPYTTFQVSIWFDLHTDSFKSYIAKKLRKTLKIVIRRSHNIKNKKGASGSLHAENQLSRSKPVAYAYIGKIDIITGTLLYRHRSIWLFQFGGGANFFSSEQPRKFVPPTPLFTFFLQKSYPSDLFSLFFKFFFFTFFKIFPRPDKTTSQVPPSPPPHQIRLCISAMKVNFHSWKSHENWSNTQITALLCFVLIFSVPSFRQRQSILIFKKFGYFFCHCTYYES